MPFTVVILATILVYTWVLEPRRVPVAVPAAIVIGAALWSAWRSGVWGFSRRALVPASVAAALFTVPAVLIILATGSALGTLHDRGELASNFGILILWGGAQQFVLHTVVLREMQRLTSPGRSILLAAFLFAIAHVPNPLLMLMTFIGALGWCAIFQRHPNIVPLAVSHAVATLGLLYAFDDRLTGRLRIGAAFLRLHG